MLSKSFGTALGAQIYGRTFTAWGIAGLSGPWIAGFAYDLTGSYHIPFLIAGTIALIAVIAVYFSPQSKHG